MDTSFQRNDFWDCLDGPKLNKIVDGIQMQPFTNLYLFWPLKWSNTSLREKLVTIHPVVGVVSRYLTKFYQ